MMKCSKCGYNNSPESTWDGHCDECGYLIVATGVPIDPTIDSSIYSPVTSAPTVKRIINFIGDLLILQFVFQITTRMFPNAVDIIVFGKSVSAILGFNLLLMFLYYFLFEITFQQTPVKFVTRTKVVTKNGSKPRDRAIALRTLIRMFVPFLVFSMSEYGDWWHDRWTGTRVVDSKKYRR
jgi:uncharacterized RDD family membrane protein YckC